jgi:DNA polymerase-1
MKKLLIIDAHALIHRAYHALPPLTTSNGTPVGAVYGFLLMTINALKDMKPEGVVVCFDSKGPTFRHKQFKDYKGTRKETDPDLVAQFPLVEEVVKAFGFPVFKVSGFEADDLIGTISTTVSKTKKTDAIILTGDMDLLQLVNAHTKVLRLKKGVKDMELFDRKAVEATYGFTPEQVIEYKGLRGDTSDNIPGVKGIGEKGATELLKEFGTVEHIYKNLEKITGRNRKALEGQQDQAEMSRELATIMCDAPIEFSLEDAKIGKYNQTKIHALFREWEFHSLLKQLPTLPGFQKKEGLFAEPETDEEKAENAKPIDATSNYRMLVSEDEIGAAMKECAQAEVIAVDTETTSLSAVSADLVGVSISWKEGDGVYIPCMNEKGVVTVPVALQKMLEDAAIKKSGHNIKYDIEVLHHAGVRIAGVVFDSMIASYILNSSSRGHGLDALAFALFDYEMQPIDELIGKGKAQISMADVAPEKVAWYAAEDADFSLRLYNHFAPKIKKDGYERLFYDIEMGTLFALVPMEEAGVKIDVPFLHDMSKDLHKRIAILDREIQEMAGAQFNVGSPVQLKEILFDKMKISTDKIKKTKTGFSTAASELEKLRGLHPIIDKISEFRELKKLTSTYIDTLPTLINPETGRIHTSYNQTIAATGRLSSTDPNLQNIPIRTELGRQIRKAFIADKGHSLVSLDYSQIELRVVAHLSGDPVMTEAFQNGEDIHTKTAAELNDVPMDKVTSDMRRASKAINFGILYGMGVQGIMRDSGISRDEARMFLDKYFSVHSGIHDYIARIKAETEESGYAETMFGRKRYLPDIQGKNPMLKAAAERAAVNMPVQGTAADIMKLAMIKVGTAIEAGKIDARMLLQVHDELVFEIEDSKVKSETPKIQKIMQEVVELSVPLDVDVEYGKNWGDQEEL